MSTKTDALPGANPAGVTHTISRAFLLEGQIKRQSWREGDNRNEQAFDRQANNLWSKSISIQMSAQFPKKPYDSKNYHKKHI